MNFDKNKIKTATREFINNNYLKNADDFNIDKIYRASKAAGPLALWVKSIIEYSAIFDNIQPLRDEVAQLEADEQIMKNEITELETLIQTLEENIEQYKVDYGKLIAEVENIKAEMTKVKDKVTRSQKLIQNLSAERNRWEDSSKNFKE